MKAVCVSQRTIILVTLLLVVLGCERERRVVETPKQATSDIEPPNLIEVNSWLYQFSANSEKLGLLVDSRPAWQELLQNRPLRALYAYDQSKDRTDESKIACARSALELATAAERLEQLVLSLIDRNLEIEASRPGVESVAGWRAYASGKDYSPFKDDLGGFGESDAPFLKAETPKREIPSPGTDGLRARWALLDALRDDPGIVRRTKFVVKKLRQMRGADFSIKKGEQTFEYIDKQTVNVSRVFFARKALDCLEGVSNGAELFRIKAFRLEGNLNKARSLVSLFKAPQMLKDSSQILSLETTPAALEQSVHIEGLKIALELGEKPKPSQIILKATSPIQWLRSDEANSLARDAVSDQVQLPEIDGLIVGRNMLAALKAMGVKDGDSAQALVTRYVDELRRQTAEAHYLRGDFPKAAQVRRRIGGGDAFSVGPKVTYSALAGSALDHWKIVEPRAAIRYLKDLGDVFPNARRAADLLRDILSYRARQTGGQTAAGQ